MKRKWFKKNKDASLEVDRRCELHRESSRWDVVAFHRPQLSPAVPAVIRQVCPETQRLSEQAAPGGGE